MKIQILVSWLTDNGFPVQKIVQGDNLQDVLKILAFHGIDTKDVIGIRKVEQGDFQRFGVLDVK